MTRLVKVEEGPLPAMGFGELVQMGEQLVRTGFLPQHLRSGAQVAAVVLTGRELGMAPMRAIRSLSMVKGKVVESADSQLARFKADGGRAQFRRLDDTVAELWLRHPNGDEHVESFGLADASRAGIASDMYKKFPKAMLRSRAITAGLKSLGWEGGVGTYDPEELRTEPPVERADLRNDVPAAAQGGESGSPASDATVDEHATLEQYEAITLKGKRLGDMDTDRLEQLYRWAVDKGNNRLATAIEIILHYRVPTAAEAEVTADETEEVGA